MGYKVGAYCKCWEITPVSEKDTKVRLSISYKNKQTGEFEDDFTGYVHFLGSDVAHKASSLNRGDRIKLGDVDVRNWYDKEKKQEYHYYKCFGFEMADRQSNDNTYQPKATSAENPSHAYEGSTADDSELPF